MTDKELLELAAKAIGYDLHVNEVDATQLWKDGAYVCFWMPLDDDGDALRLAVKLHIGLEINNGTANAVWIDFNEMREKQEQECCDEYFEGIEKKQSAVRRAIVRAAAKIGKTL